jgi:DNA-binding XRE family transcriptional regulator
MRRGRAIVASGKFRQVREAAGLNRMEMARLFDVWVGTIINWEHNRCVPVADHAILIADMSDELTKVAAEQPQLSQA